MDFYRRRKIEAHIDMTPMIDTLLQLFLIFMMSATFVASAARLDLPRGASNQKPVTERIVVSIDANEGFFLNNTPISRSDLKEKLAAVRAITDDYTVLLKADRTLAYQKVLEALLEIQDSGAGHVFLAHDADARR